MLAHGADAEREHRRIRRAGVRSSLHALHPHMSSLHDEWQDTSPAPKSLPGLLLWLRGDLGITLNGATVSAWSDQSGNGNNATQGSGGSQPSQSTGINGQACVRFNGSTGMIVPNFLPAATQPKSYAIVYKLTATPGASTTWALLTLLNASSNETLLYVVNNAGYTPYAVLDDCSGLTASIGSAKALDTSAHAVIQTYSGGNNASAASYTLSVDGVSQSLASTGSLNHEATQSSLACRVISGVIGIGAQTDIAEVIVTSGVMSAASQSALAAYFLGRYGVS